MFHFNDVFFPQFHKMFSMIEDEVGLYFDVPDNVP